MCRFITVAADRPVRLDYPLLTAPHALVRQSNRDRRGLCHDNGWGLGHFADGEPARVRSTNPAWQDPLFRETVNRVQARVAVAHVRLATIGRVAERNCHPFAFGPWLFAHNGTLVGFAAEPEALLSRIPEPFREGLEGETDSEHIFRLMVSRLPNNAAPDELARIVRVVIRELANLYPGSDADPTRLNIVLTDGHTLIAVRWGHWLFRFDQHAAGPITADDGGDVHVVALASEACAEEGWQEVPDRSVVLIREDLSTAVLPIHGAAPVQPLS